MKSSPVIVIPDRNQTTIDGKNVSDLQPNPYLGATHREMGGACSHAGGGPQVGEAPHLPVVKESQPSHAILTTGGAGVRFRNASRSFLLGQNPGFNKSSFFVKLFFTVTAHFIPGLFGLSEPFKAKFIEEINR